jgi:threonine/homoserine/homoserine lactone efflux protein
MPDQALSSAALWRPLLTLVAAAVVMMGSPGPSTMSVTAVGAAFGPRRSLPYAGGLVLGTSTVLLAVATGVVALILSVPRLGPVLGVISALYILYLAVKIATAPPLSAGGRDIRAPSFGGGYLLAIANPKAYFAIAAVFTSATLALGSPLRDAALKSAVLVLLIILIHAAWLFAGVSLARLLRDPLRSRIANALFAAVLVGTGLLALLR